MCLSLKAEVVKSIQGESAFSQSMLAALVEDSEKKCESLKAQCEKAESEVESSKNLIKDLNEQYDEIISWSSLYDSASIEAKKMIVNSMIWHKFYLPVHNEQAGVVHSVIVTNLIG